MEWIVNHGQIYHCVCRKWTLHLDTGTCDHCHASISQDILNRAREQAEDRAHIERNRDLQRSLKSISRRLWELGLVGATRPSESEIRRKSSPR
jgi:hypothetical protein